MKSTAQHRTDGTFRGDRHRAKVKAVMLANLPDAPPNLSDEGCKYWQKKCAELNELGILNSLDYDGIARLCSLYATQDKLQEMLNKEKNTKKYFQILAQVDKCCKLILPLEKEFALTPVSRVRLRIDKPKEKDEFEDF